MKWNPPDPAVFYLLGRHKARELLERRSLLAVYLASALFGIFLGSLFSKPEAILPLASGCSILLLCLVRMMGDGSVLYGLLLGGAWREIRLSRLRAAEVVDGIALFGLKKQLSWAVAPALGLALVDARMALYWFLCVLLASTFGSYWGQTSVVQRVIRDLQLPFRQQAAIVSLLSLVICSTWVFPFGVTLGLFIAWLTVGLRYQLASALDRIPEAFSLDTPSKVQARLWSWTPWSENPIVARECARESQRLSRDALIARLYFGSFGLVLGLLPLAYLWFQLPGILHRAPRFGESPTPWILAAFLMVVAWLQAVRSGQRVYRALAEERDRQTLDLLVVTSLRSEDFVDGWAQVGATTRQWDVVLVTLACLFSVLWFQPSVAQVALVTYSGLLGMLFSWAGAYCGLLLGFRACARRKYKRHLLFPLILFVWLLASLPLAAEPWAYLLAQAGAATLVTRYARRCSLQALKG